MREAMLPEELENLELLSALVERRLEARRHTIDFEAVEQTALRPQAESQLRTVQAALREELSLCLAEMVVLLVGIRVKRGQPLDSQKSRRKAEERHHLEQQEEHRCRGYGAELEAYHEKLEDIAPFCRHPAAQEVTESKLLQLRTQLASEALSGQHEIGELQTQLAQAEEESRTNWTWITSSSEDQEAHCIASLWADVWCEKGLLNLKSHLSMVGKETDVWHQARKALVQAQEESQDSEVMLELEESLARDEADAATLQTTGEQSANSALEHAKRTNMERQQARYELEWWTSHREESEAQQTDLTSKVFFLSREFQEQRLQTERHLEEASHAQEEARQTWESEIWQLRRRLREAEVAHHKEVQETQKPRREAAELLVETSELRRNLFGLRANKIEAESAAAKAARDLQAAKHRAAGARAALRKERHSLSDLKASVEELEKNDRSLLLMQRQVLREKSEAAAADANNGIADLAAEVHAEKVAAQEEAEVARKLRVHLRELRAAQQHRQRHQRSGGGLTRPSPEVSEARRSS